MKKIQTNERVKVVVAKKKHFYISASKSEKTKQYSGLHMRSMGFSKTI